MDGFQAATGYISLLLAGCVASAGGIGGGSLNVPILLVIFNYDYDTAVVLSACTICGNCLGQLFVNRKKAHPDDPTRPLIYWDAVLTLWPSQVGGSSLGVILTPMLPETILVIVSALVLTFAIIKTAFKGIQMWRSESELDVIADSSAGIYNTLLDDSMISSTTSSSTCSDQNALSYRSEEEKTVTVTYDQTSPSPSFGNYYTLVKNRGISDFSDTVATVDLNTTFDDENLAKKDRDDNDDDNVIRIITPLLHVKILAFFFVFYAAIYIVSNLFSHCSFNYFVTFGAAYPVVALLVAWSVNHFRDTQIVDPGSIKRGDFDFTQMGILLPLLAFVVGIFCSLLGIGGGELLGPILLSLKVLPQVSSASTSVMSLLTTASNIVHYGINGTMKYKEGGVFFGVGISAGLIGRKGAMYIAKKYGRYSVLILALVLVLVLALGLVIFHLITDKADYSIDNIC